MSQQFSATPAENTQKTKTVRIKGPIRANIVGTADLVVKWYPKR